MCSTTGTTEPRQEAAYHHQNDLLTSRFRFPDDNHSIR
jgi:hypothetical protein